MRSSIVGSILVAFCPALNVQAQTTQPQAQPQPQQIHWAVKLGLRSQQVSHVFPLIDRVVLVPDGGTYLDEISKWSLQGRWPVLIEDDRLAPMFVRRFQPAQLLRRESVGERAIDQAALEAVVIRAFGGDPTAHTIRAAFAQHKFIPAGVVIASTNDPAWTAAVALAAGRGQPIVWLTGHQSEPNQVLSDAAAKPLLASIEGLLNQTGYRWSKLDDEIETVTICHSMAVAANIELPPAARVAAPPPHNTGPVALTDLIGRNADGSRGAFAGWIFGDETRSAYLAMCSLFLPRDRVRLVNGYPNEANWSAYGTASAANAFQQRGYEVANLEGIQANEAAWLRGLMGGFSTDLIAMNTKGNADFFDLFTGSCRPNDVPLLNEPAAIHLIHSWALQEPANRNTVGGRWFDNGACALVGSCYEPYLNGFVPPAELANRVTNFVPLLVAARWWEDQAPFAKPWRVVTIGDPLMLVAPPAKTVKQRVNRPADYGLDLAEHVKGLMRQAPNDESGRAFADALHILDMLGRDDVAVELWKVAAGKGQGHAAARQALGPLFRLRDVDEFMRAWDQLPARDDAALDMLWHTYLPRLGAAADEDVLVQLQSALRQPRPDFDLERLVPHLARRLGVAHARAVVERSLRQTTDNAVKQRLADMLKAL